MSSLLFGKPKVASRVLQQQAEPEQEVEMIEEEAGVARKKERKRLLRGGRRGTILSGIQSALKKRLGE